MKRYPALLFAAATAALCHGAAGAAASAAELAESAARYESGADESALRQLDAALSASVGSREARDALESALVRMLAADATFEAKRFACSRLSACGTERCVPALAALLKRDETVGVACLALGGIAAPRAGEALREAAASSSGLSQLQLVQTLDRRAEPESVPLLTELARGADAKVAQAACRALGAIRAEPARAAVAALYKEAPAALGDAAADAALAVAEGLAASGERKGAQARCAELLGRELPEHLRRGAFALALRCDRDGGEARALEMLGAETADPVLAPVAIARVPELRGWRVSKKFGALLPRQPAALRALLIDALASRGDAAACAAVSSQAEAEEAGVRLAAAAALGRVGDADAVPALVAALGRAVADEERKPVELALAGLRGGAKTDRAVGAALAKSQGALKLSLISVLSRRGGRDAVAVLLDQACGEDAAAARAASQALARVANAGDAAALPELQRALAGKDAARSDAALRALAAWRGADAWDSLMGVCRSPDAGARRSLALRGLVRIAAEGNAAPDAALAGRYRELAACAKDDGERKLVLGALAGAAHPDTLSIAVRLLAEPGVRPEAEQAVARLAAALEKSHPDLARDALQKAQVRR